jgi:hypothetical protein
MGIRLNDNRKGSINMNHLLAAIFSTILILLAWTHQGATGDIPERTGTTSTTVCFEDEPCFDCNTMGNGLCSANDQTPFQP